jgi:hypothetical protein
MKDVKSALTVREMKDFANEEFLLLAGEVNGIESAGNLPLVIQEMKRVLLEQKTRLYLEALSSLSLAQKVLAESDDLSDVVLVLEAEELVTRIKNIG